VEALFSQTSAQFGLAVGLLVVAVVTLARIIVVQYRKLETRYEKREAELTIERDFYRDKWMETLDAAEVGQEATHRLVRSKRRAGGS
jgi:hypothetical protein